MCVKERDRSMSMHEEKKSQAHREKEFKSLIHSNEIQLKCRL